MTVAVLANLIQTFFFRRLFFLGLHSCADLGLAALFLLDLLLLLDRGIFLLLDLLVLGPGWSRAHCPKELCSLDLSWLQDALSLMGQRLHCA